MARLIVILAALGCAALAGCEDHGEAGKSEYGTALHGENLGIKEDTPCLANFNSGLAACSPAIIGQRRYVLIRNVILPVEE